MTPEQFAYWLQGFAEMQGTLPTDQQWQMIKDHLQTVFKKETPTYTPPFTYPPGVRTPVPADRLTPLVTPPDWTPPALSC